MNLSFQILSFQSGYYLFAHSICICFYRIIWLHSSIYTCILFFFRQWLRQFMIWSIKPCLNIFCNVVINIIWFCVYNETICIQITKSCFFSIFWFYVIIQKLIHYCFSQLYCRQVYYSCVFEIFSFLLLVNYQKKNFVW